MPAAWDRLSDATNSAPLQLGIVTLGHVHTEDLNALTTRFTKLEQLVLDIAPGDPLSAHRGEFNLAVDASSTDWILVVREREVVSEPLADEIVAAIREGKARGFRIRSVPIYRGAPLRFGNEESEVRLFHRRYYLRYANKGQWDQLMIQGTVVRLSNALESVTFASAEEHWEDIAKRGNARRGLTRGLHFVRDVIGTRTFDRNTLRYIWIESARGSSSGSGVDPG
jgi:hypothetical protein